MINDFEVMETRRLAANFKMLKTSLDVCHILENYALVKRNPTSPPPGHIGEIDIDLCQNRKNAPPHGDIVCQHI